MTDIHDVRILLTLENLGELAARISHDFAEHKGISVDPYEDDLVIARSALNALRLMYERAEFARSVKFDLEELDVQPDINFEPADGFPGSFTQE